MLLLFLVACEADTPAGGKETAACPVDTGAPSLFLYGDIEYAGTHDGIPDVHVYDAEQPCDTVTSDDAGNWTWQLSARPWLSFRSEAEGLIQMQAWIDPMEGTNPAVPYPYDLGTTAQVEALYTLLGVTPDVANTTMLFVDAMSPEMTCIPDAVVTIDAAHSGSFREYADGQWEASDLTTADRADLLFTNVAPGPVTITVTDPDGAPCEGPPGVTLFAGEVTQVSFYCDR